MSEPERAAASDADGAIARRIGEWQTRLLQLNRRNNLLYFKPGRSAVGITEIAPDELDARLRRARRGLQFPHVNRRPTRRRRVRNRGRHAGSCGTRDSAGRPDDRLRTG